METPPNMSEQVICEYEALRQARMLENQARLESLGVLNTISQLQHCKKFRPYQKKEYGLTPVRRSERISNNHRSPPPPPSPPRPRSQPLRNTSTLPLSPPQDGVTLHEKKKRKKKPANAPLMNPRDADLQITGESSAKRNSKGKSSLYNPVLGICCHFCRQKKLCREKDCKRCGNFNVNEPCLGQIQNGKTNCSACHSSTGIFCRACLKVRYGEELEEVRENKGWMCPHCIEKRGINPYWICNSSICLRKRKMPPTGIAVYKDAMQEKLTGTFTPQLFRP
ncbi:Cell division cycle-associated protein 7, partial [Mucuna pruriens]